MKKIFAELNEQNILVAHHIGFDTPKDSWVELNQDLDGDGYVDLPKIGSVYDSSTQSFTSPKDPDPIRVTILSKHDFYARLTSEELAMISAPDEALPGDDADTRSARMLLKVFATQINVAEEIDLDLSTLVDGLSMLTQMGLISKERCLAIRGLSIEEES